MTTSPDTDMHALAFFVADHAVVENGKVYANGAFFNRLSHPSYPAVQQLSVVAVIHVPWRAYHQVHTFEVSIEDADGRAIGGKMEGQFQVGSAPQMKVGDPTIMPFTASLALPLERAGSVTFKLLIDGHPSGEWRIEAVQAFPPHLSPPTLGVGPQDQPQSD